MPTQAVQMPTQTGTQNLFPSCRFKGIFSTIVCADYTLDVCTNLKGFCCIGFDLEQGIGG